MVDVLGRVQSSVAVSPRASVSRTHGNSVGRLSDHILAVVWFPVKVFGHGRERHVLQTLRLSWTWRMTNESHSHIFRVIRVYLKFVLD